MTSHIVSLLWLMDEQGRPAALPPLSGSGVDSLWTCPSIADGNRALLVESRRLITVIRIKSYEVAAVDDGSLTGPGASGQ
jgi:hypothetical protein